MPEADRSELSVPEATPALPPGEATGCPPALEWQQIVQRFRAEAEPWYLDRPGGYRLTGRMWGSGPPLYFVCGMGGTHDLFALTAWLLRDSFRCVLYDYPGSLSGTIPRNVSCETYAQDLLAIAERCGDEQFDLFATSFGSLVTLKAMSLSSKPRRAVIQGGFARRHLAWTERTLIRMISKFPGRLGHIPLRKLIQSHNHRRWFPSFDKTRWQFLLDNSGQVRVAAQSQRAGIIRDTDLRPILPSISQEILLIHTEHEGLVPDECLDELANGLPHAKVERMLNSGHLPYLTHPHRIAKLIREFLV